MRTTLIHDIVAAQASGSPPVTCNLNGRKEGSTVTAIVEPTADSDWAGSIESSPWDADTQGTSGDWTESVAIVAGVPGSVEMTLQRRVRIITTAGAAGSCRVSVES